MTEKSQACMVSCIGGAIGATLAYLFFTTRGRRMRRSLEPMLEDFARELNHFRGTVTRAADVAGEGWKALHQVMGEPTVAGPRIINPHQTSPF